MRFFLLGLSIVQPLFAVIETQHAFELTRNLTERLSLNLHSRVRSEPATLSFYQIRLGPMFTYPWKPKLSLIGGYYFGRQRMVDGDFVGGHRYFGGGESMLIRRARWQSDTRFLTERFAPQNANDFTRYRARPLAPSSPPSPVTS
jgi:hypothetical protein